ncbi:MAG: hypothetical protein KC486_18705 [Myxococcales bacterium]|nr:hypothetical protein [Myxococcales bacterium]
MSERPPEASAQASAEEALPEIRDRAGVVAHYGDRVRVRGRYASRPLADLQGRVWSTGPFVVLDDETLLFFSPAERDPGEVSAHEGRAVEVVGVLAPPPAPSFDVASVTVESLTIVGER